MVLPAGMPSTMGRPVLVHRGRPHAVADDAAERVAEPRAQTPPAPGHISGGLTLQRHQAVVGIVLQAADHRGHATQGVLRADAGGFAQVNELRRDFDEQDVGLLEHDGIP
jgi:hypothetical protein